MRRSVAAALGVLLLSSVTGAVQYPLDRRAIEQAVFIGQSNLDAERRRFHGGYRIRIDEPPVDWIDVMTPFHRVVLAAETADRSGRRFGQREALQLLASSPAQLDLIVELTFHPLNTFVGVPDYTVTLSERTRRIEPMRLERTPRFNPRLNSLEPAYPVLGLSAPRGTGLPLEGGTIVAPFDLDRLDAAGRYQIVVEEGTAELARADLDLGRLR